jgi:hypothetical protein
VFLLPSYRSSTKPAVQNAYQQDAQIKKERIMKKNSKVALVTAALITFGSLAEGAMGAALFTVGNPYRHFQHQSEAGGVWTEGFDGCCFATSAATVAMSIGDNNAGITLNGFTNTSLGAETFEEQYKIGGTSGTVVNGVGAGPAWVGNGNWVGAPWFAGADAGKLRVTDYYLAQANWATIPATLPTLNVVGAFALIEAVAPFPPADVEWWSNYHVVGVYEFDFAARTMKITDPNKDRNGVEYTDGAAVHAVGGAILTGAGVLDDLSWSAAGILTNAGGAAMDDEVLTSLRVLYLVPESSSALFLVLGGLGFVFRRSRIRAGG